jgi:folate-binding protein YgfZ
MPRTFLPDRGVVRVAGEDARSFLEGIVTSTVASLTPGTARWAALLTPQGKILVDFLVLAVPEDEGGGYLLDVPRALAEDLVKRLSFYKLRAKVTITDESEALAVAALWGDETEAPGRTYDDPRLAALGRRAIGPRAEIEALGQAPLADYHAMRIAAGVPEGGKDFTYGEAFPHEVLMDQLGGVSFNKGCYIGQEVVSRMQHRGTARTRIVPVVFTDGFVPEDGATVVAGERTLGHVGSCARGRGLAMLRLDRVADALAAGLTLTAGGLALTLEKPSFATFAFPGEAAETAQS